MKRIAFYILSLFSLQFCLGQDVHFSQFEEIPIALNPALAGNSSSTKRAGLIYRNQWNSVSTPFQSSAFFADMKVEHPKLNGSHVGMGILFVNDRSGSGGLKENHLIFSSNYQRFLNIQQTYLITAGPQIGFYQKGFDPSKLNFESDFSYSSGSFISNGGFQNFSKSSVINFELGFGATVTKFDPSGLPTVIGISFSHLTTPNQSFLGVNEPLKMKKVFHANTVKEINTNMSVKPSALYMSQNEAKVLIVGAQLIYSLGTTLKEDTDLKIGAYYRIDDAVFFTFGINHDNWGINLGYDYTISNLSESAGTVNAFEIAITIKNKLFKAKARTFVLPGNRLL